MCLMRRLSFRSAVAVVVLSTVLAAPVVPPIAGSSFGAGARAAVPYEVSAWAYTDAYRTSLPMAVSAHAIDEVQGDWWYSRMDGSLSSYTPSDFVATAHSDGLRVLATVVNQGFRPGVPDSILSDPSKVRKQVNAIVNQCVTQGFDGVDLDWENMYARDRDLFSTFVQKLADSLHAQGKILGIAVVAKTSEPGTYRSQIAEDWSALGAAVDEFQVMTYEQHGSWSKPGPIADPSWMNEVIAFARTEVPAGKIWMGVPFYGYDWGRNGATTVTYVRAQRLIATHHPHIVRTASMEARFTYRRKGVRHVVYFQDNRALGAKINALLNSNPQIAGIAIWSMGGDWQGYWNLIARKLK